MSKLDVKNLLESIEAVGYADAVKALVVGLKIAEVSSEFNEKYPEIATDELNKFVMKILDITKELHR